VTILRYLDVGLVLAAAPLVALAGAPFAGYAIGAAAWILTRGAVELAHAQARSSADPKLSAGLHVAAMMGRIFFAALALILTKVLLGKADAIACAVTLLVAFTVYFVMSFATREGPLQGPTTGRTQAS